VAVDMYERSLRTLIFCFTFPSNVLPLMNSLIPAGGQLDLEEPNARLLQEETASLFQKNAEPLLNALKRLPFGELVIDPLEDFFHHSTLSSIGNNRAGKSGSDRAALLQASVAVHEAGSMLLLVLFVLLVSLVLVSCVFVICERSGSGYEDDKEFLEELAAHQASRQTLHSQHPLPQTLSSTRSVPHVGPNVGQHLCPELVVPQGNECSLLVPHLYSSHTQSVISISDLNHVPVFRVSFQNDWTNIIGNGKPRRLALSNANGGRDFAYVCDGALIAEGRPRSFTFHHQTGAIVGEISAEESATGVSFAVDLRSGLRMRIARDAKSKLKFKNESGHLLAVAKTSTEISDMPVYLLRVGSLMDAGLVVLAMLCVQLQEERHH